ncbi:hypothetical protein SAMN06272737_10644 [Blastococcus mobilis]|uniref:Uncharacterized protein n=1 Tax=Blastococcus mobilis TaxID=1938746 RepID=A0A238W2X8_9ACTN|nr:hypothetical protein SAMN06272737_10644 [Blastococcus mobilis]
MLVACRAVVDPTVAIYQHALVRWFGLDRRVEGTDGPRHL